MANHIHIRSDGKVIATLWLDQNGHVRDDGSIAARNSVEHLSHGLQRHHGQLLLDAIVHKLDASTHVSAVHCKQDHRTASVKQAAALYHWTDASNLERWMDPSHTGTGETYLTESGEPDGNPDVPRMNNPVRITIDPSELPGEIEPAYAGNHLYRGVVPPAAILDVHPFKKPEHWEEGSTEPSPEDRWPEFGEQSQDEKSHRDVPISNDYYPGV